MKKLRVAMLAPPWLPIPPDGYGGTENVLYAIVPELIKLGVRVELFTIKETSLRSSKKHWLYETGQYEHIHKPYYDTAPLIGAHLQFAINTIREDGKFDIIHDHNMVLGPLLLANTPVDMPPILHTLHNPPFTTRDRLDQGIPDNAPFWRQLTTSNKTYLVTMSEAMARNAPKQIKQLLLPPIYNAVNVNAFEFVQKKNDYFITLARFHPDKGQSLAVRAGVELGYHLKMAGVVGDLNTPQKVMMQLANPLSSYRSLPDFRYFSDQIFPYLNDHIEYVGDVKGERKLQFISRARALLFPIQWEEPFGLSVIEALACGTPVVAMKRGAMPEIIEHGVNGFLAKNYREFKKYVQQVDQIDPKACRRSVEQKFSADVIARQYLEHYRTVIERYKNSG